MMMLLSLVHAEFSDTVESEKTVVAGEEGTGVSMLRPEIGSTAVESVWDVEATDAVGDAGIMS